MCRAFSPVLAGLFVVFGSAYSQIAPRSVSLSWTASASPNVRRYKIYRGTASGGPYRLLTSPPVVGTSYIDTAVQAGSIYYYVVSALGDGNDESAYSNEAQAVIPAATPPSVHIDSPTAGATVSGIVTVSGWAIDNTSAPSAAIRSVQVLVDGTKVGEAAYGASRPDVCALYPGRPGCPNVGFTYLLDTRQLTPGSHMLKVTATDSDGIPDSGSSTVNITVVAPPGDSAGLRFVPVSPCRVMDTRWSPGPFGGPSMTGGSTRDIPVPASLCGVPLNAAAYSVNVTVVPHGPLAYLTVWPSGQDQPGVSTLNSFDGRVKANAVIAPAGANGSVSVYATNSTDVLLDINGYFVAGNNNLGFYPVRPCRVADTRTPAGPFGGPLMAGGQTRSFAIPNSSCGIPAAAQAYALNLTVVPAGPLAFLTTWPAGQTQPFVSTLNAFTGAVTANSAIVPAGGGGAINVIVTNPTDLIIDINGYFAAPGSPGELTFHPVTPCRVADTRNPVSQFGGPAMAAGLSRNYPMASSSCGLPPAASAYSLNATVVPRNALQYLTIWATGQPQPLVSTLNSFDGSVVANAAIVPAGTGGFITAYVSDLSDLILDVNGYFAP